MAKWDEKFVTSHKALIKLARYKLARKAVDIILLL